MCFVHVLIFLLIVCVGFEWKFDVILYYLAIYARLKKLCFWARFQVLRDLIPQNDQKRDKASFLLEVLHSTFNHLFLVFILMVNCIFVWLFLNSSLGIRARLFCYVIHYSKLCLGFYVFLLECYCFVLNAIFHFLLLITISFLFLLLLSFTFLLLVSFAFSVWIYGRLDFLVLFPFEDEAQLSLRFRL